jgi:hypothetical protein
MADFDPAKDAIDRSKHGISLARWVDLRIHAIVDDDRFQYGEPRYRAYGLIEGAACCLVFTIRDGQYRPSAFDARTQRRLRRHAPKS